MSLEIVPDPAHPLGGHALLRVAGAAPGPARLSVQNLFDGRYLGAQGWQAGPATLDIIATRVEAGHLIVPLGPEVVDRIEEFSTLRLSLGGVSRDLAWPGTIKTSPGFAVAGGLSVQPRAGDAAPPPRLTATDPGPERTVVQPAPAAEPRPAPPPAPPPAPTLAPDPVRPRWLIPALAGAVVLALAALAAALLLFDAAPTPAPDPVPAPVPTPVVEPIPEPIPGPTPEPVPTPIQEPTPPPVAQGCTAEALTAALGAPVAEAMALVTACGTAGDAERRFALIERGVAANDPQALLTMGKWWDPAQAAAVGSTFTRPDPGQAAGYYRRAQAAGAAEAAALLAAACAALDPATQPLHQIAADLHCKPTPP